jgi:hypothetical protein
MSRPNWQSAGVQVVMAKDSAAHGNAAFVPAIVDSVVIFGYVGCTWLLFCDVCYTKLELFKGIYICVCVCVCVCVCMYSVIVYISKK